MGHNLGKYYQPENIIDEFANRTFCIHPHNNLEVIDMPNLKLSLTQTSGPSFGISGLRKLRYLNLQGGQFPIFVSAVTLFDMDTLTEVHIGGSKLAENDILPTHTLHIYVDKPVHIKSIKCKFAWH